MAIINAQGKVFRTWEGVLNACQAQTVALPNVEPLKSMLQDIFNRARQVKALQEENQARRQGLTQELAELIQNGQETARRLRGYAKSQLGTKNELLVQFGAAPIRPRVRSVKKSSEPASPSPSKPAP